MNADEFVRAARKGGEELVEVGLRLAEQLEGEDRAKVLGTLGNLYFDLERFEEAEKAYIDALQTYIKLAENDETKLRFVAACLQNLGNLYHVQRRFEEAEKAYIDALRVLEFVGDDQQRLQVLAAYGTMLAKLGFDEKALKVLGEALGIAKKLGDSRTAGVILNNLAVLLRRAKRCEEAKVLLREALEFLGDSKEGLIAMLNLIDEESVELAEGFEGRIAPLDAKIKYLKAKRAEGEEKERLMLEAGCLGFLAYKKFGISPINYIYCLEVAARRFEEAEKLKRVVMKCYFGSGDASGEDLEFLLRSDLEVVRKVAEEIRSDLEAGVTFRQL
ncbi:MAG: tetratricopeptide repeat protein [Archaeoglobaceae archaeon]